MNSQDSQRAEVDASFRTFIHELPLLLPTDRNRFAIYRNAVRVGIVDTFSDALEFVRTTGGFPASVQEITEESVMPPSSIGTAPTPITSMTADKATGYADALADVLCWFNGFLMGKGEEAMMPPGWRALRNLSADLKEHSARMRRIEPGADQLSEERP